MFLSLIIGSCGAVLPIKDNLFIALNRENTFVTNIIVTFSIVFLTTTAGFLYPAVSDWIALIGSLSGVFLGIFFPAYCFWYLYKDEPGFKIWTNFALGYAIVVSILGLSSSAVILLFIFGIQKEPTLEDSM